MLVLNDKNHILEEMKYQATSIFQECEQKLAWWYFYIEYIEEKLEKVNNLFNNYKQND